MNIWGFTLLCVIQLNQVRLESVNKEIEQTKRF